MWYKKKDVSSANLTLTTPLSSPRIEELENEFMNTLKKMYNQSEIQTCQHRAHAPLVDTFFTHNSSNGMNEQRHRYPTKFSAGQRLLITRSIDDFGRTSIEHFLYSSVSSEPIHQALLKKMIRRANHSDTLFSNDRVNQMRGSLKSSVNNMRTSSSSLSIESELYGNVQNSLQTTLQQDQPQSAAILEIEHQSLSTTVVKSLEKSYSSPLPIRTNHLSFSNNHIESAHIIDQYQYKENSGISLYSCVSEMGNDQSMESSSSDQENIERSLLHRQANMHKNSLRHRWSLVDIWKKTMTKLPPILNCIWRQQLYHTGSREFLLEYDQTLPTNTNNNHRRNVVQEQRYVEQERPIHSHIGLALLALLIFPPVGVFAMILSIWCLCGQQDRHLSRKFGNAVYWISMAAICLSFLLLFTLFSYFTYQYLINRSLTTHRTYM